MFIGSRLNCDNGWRGNIRVRRGQFPDILALVREIFGCNRDVSEYIEDIFGCNRGMCAYIREIFGCNRVMSAYVRDISTYNREIFARDRDILSPYRDRCFRFNGRLQKFEDFVYNLWTQSGFLADAMHKKRNRPQFDVNRTRSTPESCLRFS